MTKAMVQPGLGEALPHLTDTGCLYLDYNATTPIWPQVADAMAPFLTHSFGNPSSIHIYGRTCKAAVEKARQQVAGLIGATPEQIYFTSCGTESDHWAIYAAVMGARKAWDSSRTPHVLCSSIEHPAVLAYLEHLQAQGLLTFTAVPCDSVGLIDPAAVAAALTADTVLVTIMHSNNEVGTIQPIQDIARAARQAAADTPGFGHTLLIHTDAAQSLGKVQVSVDALGVDMLTIVGHKFGAPKGVAALWSRDPPGHSFLHGGGQERGRRAGTENVLLVVGLGAAADIATREGAATIQHVSAMRERLLQQLQAGLPPNLVHVNGPTDPGKRLPNTLSVSIKGLNASQALTALKDQLAASAGAACHSSASSQPTMSAVLRELRLDPAFGLGTLRLSVGRHTTPAEVDRAAQLLLQEASAQGVPVITGQPLQLDTMVQFASDPAAGAVATFSGVTRNNFDGKEVTHLEYEAYEPMAVKKLQEVAQAALAKWHVIRVAVAHRTGVVEVMQPSVIIVASSAHRRDALEAVHWMIDELKAVVPIWKKEFFSDGSQWKENEESRQRLLMEQAAEKPQHIADYGTQ